MKTDREKAKSLVQYWLSNHENHDQKYIELEGFLEQALTEARLEGAKMMQEKAAKLIEENVVASTNIAPHHKLQKAPIDNTRNIYAKAIRVLNPSEVVKGEK